MAPILIVLINPAAKFTVLIFIELIDPAITEPVLRVFVLTFAVVTPPAGENPPAKFNVVNVAVPALSVFVLISPEFEMLPVFVVPSVVVPVTPRVPPTTKLLLIEALPPTPRDKVLIFPELLILTEVRMLPKSSFPTKRFVT